jgi:hypothetical protein
VEVEVELRSEVDQYLVFILVVHPLAKPRHFLKTAVRRQPSLASSRHFGSFLLPEILYSQHLVQLAIVLKVSLDDFLEALELLKEKRKLVSDGCFVNLRTIGFFICNKSITLATCCKTAPSLLQLELPQAEHFSLLKSSAHGVHQDFLQLLLALPRTSNTIPTVVGP